MWILDSWESHHVCPYIKCISDIKGIDPVYIHLPNGTRITANFYGTIILDPFFHLHNVFYILEFRFSLISISKYAILCYFILTRFLLHSGCVYQADD